MFLDYSLSSGPFYFTQWQAFSNNVSEISYLLTFPSNVCIETLILTTVEATSTL
jgi:hypothetical protein